MKKIFRFLVVLSILFTTNIALGGALNDGWKAFNDNNRIACRTQFNKALGNPAEKSEAYLGLALLEYKEGHEEEAFQNFKAFYESSSDPYPYLYSLWSSGVLNKLLQKLSDDKVAFLKKILEDNRANGTIKTIISQQLGYDAFLKNDYSNSNKYFNSVNSINKWQFVGVFDNTSGSGFDKAYAPQTDPSASAMFDNKVGAKVKWYTIPQSRYDKWVDFAFSFNYGNSIMFAQSFVKSETEQDIVLRLGVSGSMKVWINDALVGSESEERNTDIDVYNYKTHLNKGYNRILVQIGESEADNANFLLRITDEKGNPISGLTVSSEPQPYTKLSTIKSEQIPLFAETFFEAKIKENPSSIINYYLLANTYLRNDKVYEARKVLYKAKELAPNSGYLSRSLMEAYSREGNTTDQSKESENLKKIDPENISAIQTLIDEAETKEDYDEMEKLVDKLESLYGEDQRTLTYRLSIAGNRKKNEEIVKIGEEGYKKYPDAYTFVKMKSAIEQEVNKSMKGAIGVYEKYLKNNNSESARVAVASLYFKNGSPDKGVKMYEQIIADKPYAVGYLTDLSEYYTETKNYTKAIDYAEQALEYAPYIGSFWARLGKVYDAMNNKSEAIENLNKATYYNPNDYETKKLLRKLKDEKDIYDYFESVDVDKIATGKVTVPVREDDNAVILHIETQKIIYAEGGSEEKHIVVSKILTKSGVDNWKEYQIDYNPYSQRIVIEEAKIVKPNGNKIEAEKDRSYLVFTGLEVGDVVTIVYRLENYSSGKLANDFWEEYNFNSFYPRQDVKVSYIIPNKKKFEYKAFNTDMKPTTKPIENNYTLYTWEQKDQPAIKDEPYMPPLSDVGKMLHISSLPDWNYVASVYSDMSTTKAKENYEVKELISTLFKDKTNLTELQKAKIIYEWILDNIHYSHVSFRQSGLVPQKASTTINTKLGDCKDLATLFVSMAKEVGVKANLVLINTHDNGEKDLQLPSLDFNHCIAKVFADGKEYYLELTYPDLSFGAQTSNIIGCLSLNIPNASNTSTSNLAILKHPNSVDNNVRRETEITFDNNDIVVKRVNMHYGAYAASRRNDYREKSKEEREKDMQQTISKSFTKPVKLTGTDFSDFNELIDSTISTYYYTVKGGLTDFGGMKLFEIPWTDDETTPAFLSTDKRVFDINFWEYDYADVMVETIKIKIPAGKTLVEMPKSQKFTFKNTTYSLDYKLVGDQLIAQRKVVYGEKVIPSASYEEFKEFYNKVVQEDHKQIGFK